MLVSVLEYYHFLQQVGFYFNIFNFLLIIKFFPHPIGRSLQSLNVSMISFFIVTYGYWFNCRYQFSKKEFIQRQTEATFIDEIEEIQKRKSKQDG